MINKKEDTEKEFNLTVKAAVFNNIDDIQTFYIKVPEDKRHLIIKRLELERKKIIEYLKDLKLKNLINTISHPIDIQILKKVKRGNRTTNLRYKKLTDFQVKLDRLVYVKKELLKSINSIRLFYKY